MCSHLNHDTQHARKPPTINGAQGQLLKVLDDYRVLHQGGEGHVFVLLGGPDPEVELVEACACKLVELAVRVRRLGTLLLALASAC